MGHISARKDKQNKIVLKYSKAISYVRKHRFSNDQTEEGGTKWGVQDHQWTMRQCVHCRIWDEVQYLDKRTCKVQSKTG